MSRTILLLFLAFVVAVSGCSTPEEKYEAEVDAWHEDRVEELRRPGSWLSLAGLYWLREGVHRFGSASDNDVVFPSGAPAYMGTFTVVGDTVRVTIDEDVEVTSNGRPVQELVMETSTDDEAEPTPLSWGSLTWILIERDGRFAIRLKDSENAEFARFEGVERFPVAPQWRLEARWEAYDSVRTMRVMTERGGLSRQTTPGRVHFDLDGQTYSLDVTGDPGDERFFVMFADETNGVETYRAGRYMWIDAPDAEGNVTLDFNKSYNPPCVFTQFATCPLPPPRNHLDVRVEAGEKNYESVPESRTTASIAR